MIDTRAHLHEIFDPVAPVDLEEIEAVAARRRRRQRRTVGAALGVAVVGAGVAAVLLVPGDNNSTPVKIIPSVSTPNRIVVPDVVGLPAARAASILEQTGLTVQQTIDVSSVVPRGDVVGQGVPAGSLVAFGSVVSIGVSQGPPTATSNPAHSN